MEEHDLRDRVHSARAQLLVVLNELDSISDLLGKPGTSVKTNLEHAKNIITAAGSALDAAASAASERKVCATTASSRDSLPWSPRWEFLPDEVLCKIFFESRLQRDAYPAVRQVCRSWKTAFDAALDDILLSTHLPADSGRPLAKVFPALTSVRATSLPKGNTVGWAKLQSLLGQLAQLPRLEALTLNKECLAVAKSVLTNPNPAWPVVPNRAPWHESGGERSIVMALPAQITALSTLRSLNIVNNSNSDSADWRSPYTAEPRYSLSHISCCAPLSAMPNLASLQLAALLPAEQLVPLRSLTALHITHSATVQPALLTALPALTSLRSLHLERIYTNPIGENLSHGLSRLTLLTSLCLRDSHLLEVPAVVSLLTGLQHLDLTRNKLTALGPHLGPLLALRTLHLPLNALAPFPEHLSRLPAIAQVHLGSSVSRLNHLASSTSFHAFCAVPTLEKVSLAAVRLRALPSQLMFSRPLAVLDLSGNHLTFLPPAFSHLTSLQVLQLPGNRISALPSFLSSFTRLHTLDVNRNRNLTELHFPCSLTCLLAANNSLWSLPPYTPACTLLACLDLSSNPLAGYPWHTLAPLTALTRLHLDALSHSMLPPVARAAGHQAPRPSSSALDPSCGNTFVDKALQYLTSTCGTSAAAALAAAPLGIQAGPVAGDGPLAGGAPPGGSRAGLQDVAAALRDALATAGDAAAGPSTSGSAGASTSAAAGSSSAGASGSAAGPSSSGQQPPAGSSPKGPRTRSLKGKEPAEEEPPAPPASEKQLAAGQGGPAPAEAGTSTGREAGPSGPQAAEGPASGSPLPASPPSPHSPFQLPGIHIPPHISALPIPTYLRTLPALMRRTMSRLHPFHLAATSASAPPPPHTHPFPAANHPCLEILSLAGSRRAPLPPPHLAPLTLLRSLNLSRSELQAGATLQALYPLGRLTHLDLSVNLLTALHPEVSQLTSLQQLDLSSNALEVLPQQLFALPSLRTLLLCANHLKQLPEMPHNNSTLRVLDVRINSLQGLPGSLPLLAGLTDLLLDQPLDLLPTAIALKLRACRLSTSAHGPSRVRLASQDQPSLDFFGLPLPQLSRFGEHHMPYWAAPPFLHHDLNFPAPELHPLMAEDLLSDDGGSDDSLVGMEDEEDGWVQMMEDDMPHLTDSDGADDL